MAKVKIHKKLIKWQSHTAYEGEPSNLVLWTNEIYLEELSHKCVINVSTVILIVAVLVPIN